MGAGAIGLSAVAALAARGVDPVERSPYDVAREIAAERGVSSPPVIFECVGAAGLLQQIVAACPPGSRICWYKAQGPPRIVVHPYE